MLPPPIGVIDAGISLLMPDLADGRFTILASVVIKMLLSLFKVLNAQQ